MVFSKYYDLFYSDRNGKKSIFLNFLQNQFKKNQKSQERRGLFPIRKAGDIDGGGGGGDDSTNFQQPSRPWLIYIFNM